MNKFMPFIIMTMVFTGFLAGQILFDELELGATTTKKEAKQYAFYEKNLKKIKGKTFEGKDVDLTKKVPRVVILNFWASWCMPCLEEFPSLVKFGERYKGKDVLVLGINTDIEDIRKSILKIRKRFKFNFNSILDKDKWTTLFNIDAIPVSIIYVDGKVFDVGQGAHDFMDKKLLDKVDSLFKSTK